MYKKLFAAGLALSMALSLAACAAPPSSETAAPSTQGSSTATVPSTSANLDFSAFEPCTLIDNENVLFKISSVSFDSIWGYALKVQIENRTDKDLMFSLHDVSVNGFMCDPFFAATVTAGMKANKEISFSTDSLEEIGIQKPTQVEFKLKVYDSNDWTQDDVLSEVFTIYPLGENAATEHIRQSQESDIILFDNEHCTMIITGFDPDSVWGYSAMVYLVNKTDTSLMFSVGDASVNGFMCSPYFAKTVTAGKQCITAISWSDTVLEENEITQVETLTLPIRVYDPENWTADPLLNETFTVNP